MAQNRRPARKKGPTARKSPPEEVPSARYTPPSGRRAPRFRPWWHRLIGAVLALVGATLVFGNYAAIFPGGHKEAYFFGGVLIAATSTWWFGLFDPPM